MGLFRFVLGILGGLLVVGAFTLFIPLVFLGGISTGSVALAFGLPVSLMALGAAMIYFGFYFRESTQLSNFKIIWIAK